MAGFDLDAARKQYSDTEIANYLGQSRGFDVAAARKSGYSDQELINHFMTVPSPKAQAQAGAPDSFLGEVGDTLKGEGDVVATGVGNMATRAINAGADIVSRVTGQGPRAKPLINNPQLGPSGQRLVQNVGSALPTAGREVTDEELRSTDPTGQKPIEQLRAEFDAERAKPLSQVGGEAGGIAGNTLQVGQDVMDIAPAAGVVKSAVGAARGVTAAAGDAAQAAARQAQQAAWEKLGLRNGEGQGVAKAITPGGGDAALQANNAQAGNAIAQGEAGVPHNQLLGADTLETARAAPEQVFGRVAKAVPEGPLDQTASAAADAVPSQVGKLATTSDATKTTIQNIVDRLKAPKTGDERLNDLRSLRQEGYKQSASDDVDMQSVGRAKLALADAVEGHITRAIPDGADVTPEQFTAARTALAKNWTVDSVLKGNDVDLAALGRLHSNNPNLLTGPLRDLADFSSKNPSKIAAPGRAPSPNVVEDLKNSISLSRPVGSAIEGLMGPIGRRMLTGGPAAGRAAARAAVPGRLGDEFAPIAPRPAPPGTVNFTPPEGAPPLAVAGEGAGGPHGAPAGRPGDIPLSDVLSHGVEQRPPAGLSVAPMGSPQGEGIPFRVNAEHAAGGLETAPENAWFNGGQPERLGDLAAVMSQGVPEGTLARTAAPAPGVRSVRQPSAGKLGDMLANNASGESAASQEAINRGTRDLVQVDPDGNETPVLRDVTQIDRNAPKGHLIVDRNSGEIVSRGAGMNKQAAEGLRNRWASRERLGDTFVSAR